MILLQCPCCSAKYPLEAGFIEVDGKQLAALTADMQPAIAKAALLYLGLFSPAKSALKNAKAVKLLTNLKQLINSGSVTNDARTNETKPTTIEIWLAGLEQVVEQRSSLTLPLKNHNYLRAIVWGIASDPKQVAALKPATNNPKITDSKQLKQEQYSKIKADLSLGLITTEQAEKLLEALEMGG